MAIIFFGFLAYVLIGLSRSWRVKIGIFLSSVFAVFLIGISRVYLGVHWPSDVLGGFLLGAWWLVMMITVVYLYENFVSPPTLMPTDKLTFGRRAIVIFVLACSLLFYWLYAVDHPLRTVNVGAVEILQRRVIQNLDPPELSSLTKNTETLRGRTQTPINVIVVGSRADLESAFRAAGWEIADPVTLNSVWKIVNSSLANTSYPAAPISPSFYGGRVQDIGVEKETSMRSARQRHHARFWLAPLVLADGQDIWLGTASFDSGLAYSPTLKIPTHTISPDIDKERDFIRDELTATGREVSVKTVSFGEPTLGLSGVGAPFFTDGQARVLWLKK